MSNGPRSCRRAGAVRVLALALLPILLSPVSRAACPPRFAWAATYNSPANSLDGASAVTVDGDGNIVVAGHEDRSDLGQGHNWLVRKYDEAGRLVWSKSYNSPANRWDSANAVAVDARGNVVVAGQEDKFDLGQGFNWLIHKYDPAGTLLWSKSYDSPAHRWDSASAVTVDAMGNVYAAGREDRPDLKQGANWLIRKYDSGGELVWARSYNGPASADDWASAVAVDGRGNLVVAGRQSRIGQGFNWVVRRYDSSGKLLWSKEHDGPAHGNDWANAVVVAPDGAIYVVGREDRADKKQSTNWLIRKYDSDGGLLWEKGYDSPASQWDAAAAVALDGDGNVIVAGHEERTDLNQGHNWLVRKYTSEGRIVWAKTYNSPVNRNDLACAVVVDGKGNVVVAGHEDRSDLGQSDNWLIRKYDRAGRLAWSETYNSPANRWGGANAVAVDSGGAVIVAGHEDRSDLGEGFNWLVRKYSKKGKLVWSVSYNSPANGNDWANAMAVDANGDVVVAGHEDRFDLRQGFNWLVRKYSKKGELIWSKTYNSPADRWDGAYGVAIDSRGNILVAGREFRPDLGQSFNWLVRKYDSSGKLIWGRRYNGDGNGWDGANAVAVDGKGNVLVAGREDEFHRNENFNWLVRKYDGDGRLLWSRSYNSPGNGWDGATSLATDPKGNVFVAGREDRTDLGQSANWRVTKYSAAGETLWTATYNNPGNGDDFANSAAVDGDGNLVVAGREDRFDLGQSTNWLIRKYAPAGELLWSISYNSPADSWDGANAVALDPRGNVVVAGSEFRSDLGQGHNWLVQKYDYRGGGCE